MRSTPAARSTLDGGQVPQPDRAMTPSIGVTSLHILTSDTWVFHGRGCDAVYLCTWAPTFLGSCSLQLQSRTISALKTEAAGSSEAGVTLYQTTRRYVPRKLDTNRREKLGIQA
jgi:hypothetical protein